MNKIFTIILKDTRIRFTSPVEWLFFLVLPIIFILILSGGTTAPADQRITLYVVDNAQSALSNSLISELKKSTAVRPELKERDEALDDLEALQVSAVLIIPEGFDTNTLQAGQAEVEIKQQPNRVNALIDQQAVQAALSRLSSLVDIANNSTVKAEAIRAFASEDERQAYFEQSFNEAQRLMAETPQRIKRIEGATPDQIEYDPRANSTAGQMITWVFIPLIGLSAMFALERQMGTLRRLLITPTRKALYIGGTVLGQVITALVQMALLIIFGTLVMKINWGHSPLALIMIMTASALAAASLGTMLGTLVKTESQANGLSIMIGMLMAMMGGCWYPIELFPPALQSASKILPTAWAMQGFLDIAVRAQGPSGVALESLVLLGFALVFFSIGVWRFKFE